MNDLHDEIFGHSDSDLSSEDDEPKQVIYRRTPSVSASSAGASDIEAQEEYAEADDDDADEYRQKKLPEFKKKTRVPRGDNEQPRERKRRSKKSKPIIDENLAPEEMPELTEAERRKLELDMRIDAVVKNKGSRPRKRKKGEEDILDQAADEEVSRLKGSMIAAALEDQEANKAGLPGLSKLKMLPEVTEILQKQGLMQSVVDQNLLEAVKLWLEPQSDKSLPALNIQRAIFDILSKMFIDTSALKESGIGRVVLFYTKPNKRVSAPIRNQADSLVAAWSRPILKQSASYRDRDIVVAAYNPEMGLQGNSSQTRVKLSQILAQGRLEDEGKVRKNAVSIPQRSMASYTVVPQSALMAGLAGNSAAAQIENERRRAQQDRMKKVQRKIQLNKQRAAMI